MTRTKIVDCDAHVLEPADLWERYLEERDLLPLAPTFYLDADGVQQFKLEGKTANRGVIGVGGRNAGKPFTPDVKNQRWEEQTPGGFDPHKRIPDMNLEGIDVAVLFPTVGSRFTGLQSGPLAAALCRAYNYWLADYCRPYPDRLVGVGLVPFQDPELAIPEMRRAIEKIGFKAIFIRPNPARGRNLDHPDYAPFWDTAQGLGVPIVIHEGGGMRSIPTIAADRFDNPVFRHMCSHAMEQQIACMTLILGGVLERFPRLKVGFMEAGGGWLPYWLERMDDHKERMGWLIPECKSLPSEYFRRQCKLSVEPGERMIPAVVDLVGDEYLMFASDYPHFDCTFPGAVSAAREAKISPAAMDKLLGENARAFYNLP